MKVPKEQLHRVPVVRCKPQGCMEGLVVGGVEQRARGWHSDAFKGHVSPEMKVTITGRYTNTDLVVITRGMTSQLQVLNVEVKKQFETNYSSCMVSGFWQVPCCDPSKKIQKTQCDHFFIGGSWQHGRASHQSVRAFQECSGWNWWWFVVELH